MPSSGRRTGWQWDTEPTRPLAVSPSSHGVIGAVSELLLPQPLPPFPAEAAPHPCRLKTWCLLPCELSLHHMAQELQTQAGNQDLEAQQAESRDPTAWFNVLPSRHTVMVFGGLAVKSVYNASYLFIFFFFCREEWSLQCFVPSLLFR